MLVPISALLRYVLAEGKWRFYILPAIEFGFVGVRKNTAGIARVFARVAFLWRPFESATIVRNGSSMCALSIRVRQRKVLLIVRTLAHDQSERCTIKYCRLYRRRRRAVVLVTI